MSNTPSTLDTAKFRHLVLEKIDGLETLTSGIAGFNIPAYDEVTFDNNGNGDPTEIYFKKYTPTGTQTIFYLNLGYDSNGHLNRISNDN